MYGFNELIADFPSELVLFLDSIQPRLRKILKSRLFLGLNKLISRKYNSNAKPNPDRIDSSFQRLTHSNAGLVFPFTIQHIATKRVQRHAPVDGRRLAWSRRLASGHRAPGEDRPPLSPYKQLCRAPSSCVSLCAFTDQYCIVCTFNIYNCHGNLLILREPEPGFTMLIS